MKQAICTSVAAFAAMALGAVAPAYGLPTYLDGADAATEARYNAWASQYGKDRNSSCEAQYLLNISRTTQIPDGAAVLRVTDFRLTDTGRRFELASDICPLTQPAGQAGGACLGNGTLAFQMGDDLCSLTSGATSVVLPVLATVDGQTGRAVVNLSFADCPDSLFAAPGGLNGSRRFFRPLLAPLDSGVCTERPDGGYSPLGYRLVWSDEFNADAIGGCWTFEQGGTGWGNNELQYYCAGGVSPGGRRTAAVGDGTLKIKAYRVAGAESAAVNGCSYVSARMSTTNSWEHGYIEMRARLPMAKGCWPAFWMLLADGPYDVRDESRTGAEIDMMEYVPGDPWDEDGPNKIYFSAHSYNATRAAGPDTGYVDPYDSAETKYRYCQDGWVDDPDEWHCYGMEWTEDCIRGFVDGVQYFYAPNPKPGVDDKAFWPFNQQMYIKLNLAIGGDWGGDPAEDLTEATFEVDWVRVYQR